MSFAALITQMTEAAVRGDGAGVADCFTADGVYHDVFYGAFRGREIASMIENYFHRDAENFRWDIHDPVGNGDVGYARYVFSYDSKLDESKGKRAIFEGVAICRLNDGLIQSYTEVANAALGLSCIGFPPERLARFIAKQRDELRQRDEAAAHIE
ncbi:MAG: nuclear transport factor 2 family protein [Hyphomicrobiaceae bacterium]